MILSRAGTFLPLPILPLLLLFGCAPAAASPPRAPALGSAATAAQSPASPQGAPPVDDAPIDAATRAQVIDTALEKIAKYYVDPDVAAKIVVAVRAHQKHGDYDRVTSSVAFGQLLSAHFLEVAHDLHLRIRYRALIVPPDPAPDAKPDPIAAAAADAADRERNSFLNGDFARVERLPGNVGYVKFDGFESPSQFGDVVSAAMTFVADTDALLLDLRENQGGYPEMVSLVASYLFDGEPVQLSSIYWRDGGATLQSWTSAYVPGKRYGKEKPVYVLTSAKTVSAGEAFAYDLQAAKRATIIGETTMGGANPGNVFRAGDHFRVQIAQGRAVNPVTKTNWEGKGVKPDVAVRADLALATAEVMALEGRAEKTDDKERKEEIEHATRNAREEIDRLKRTPAK